MMKSLDVFINGQKGVYGNRLQRYNYVDNYPNNLPQYLM